MRALPALALVLVAVTACGSSAGSGERACTAIAARAGIGVDLAPPPEGTEPREATVEACWGGSCRTVSVELVPETAATETTCEGDEPDSVCSARMRETGGLTGFADLPELPAEPVEVTLTVVTADGGEYAHRTLRVTPELVYPNGPGCGGEAAQAHLTVDSQGRVHAR
ncbi:hypothetical protein B0I33_111141 [Prauserella shujinwangii]|uniref:Secreted protein n=1 Tax=Prauserella shujinwangii TaxID=1453103 RepID=A0A2T0LN94_9PSEU|nr:hypothetical protein [Prauserella shujinwangii]PRX44629.1 hypothetical protein B0I33_111141 [Prauserella shujinwangii]